MNIFLLSIVFLCKNFLQSHTVSKAGYSNNITLTCTPYVRMKYYCSNFKFTKSGCVKRRVRKMCVKMNFVFVHSKF